MSDKPDTWGEVIFQAVGGAMLGFFLGGFLGGFLGTGSRQTRAAIYLAIVGAVVGAIVGGINAFYERREGNKPDPVAPRGRRRDHRCDRRKSARPPT